MGYFGFPDSLLSSYFENIKNIMREQDKVQYEMYHWDTKESVGIIVDNSMRRRIHKDQLRNGGHGEVGNWIYFVPVNPDPNRANLSEVLRQVLRDSRLGDKR